MTIFGRKRQRFLATLRMTIFGRKRQGFFADGFNFGRGLGFDFGLGLGFEFGGGHVGVFGFGQRGGDGCGGFHRRDLLLAVDLFGGAEFVFHLHFELVGGLAELADPLAELAGKHRQALGAEEQQREHEEKDAVLKAWHTGKMIRPWGCGWKRPGPLGRRRGGDKDGLRWGGGQEFTKRMAGWSVLRTGLRALETESREDKKQVRPGIGFRIAAVVS
jgi:hypothetical protein